MVWHRRKALLCRQAVELVADYLDDALPRRDRARLERHLAGCPHCREYVEQLRATMAIVGQIRPESLAPDVRDELIELYRRWSR